MEGGRAPTVEWSYQWQGLNQPQTHSNCEPLQTRNSICLNRLKSLWAMSPYSNKPWEWLGKTTEITQFVYTLRKLNKSNVKHQETSFPIYLCIKPCRTPEQRDITPSSSVWNSAFCFPVLPFLLPKHHFMNPAAQDSRALPSMWYQTWAQLAIRFRFTGCKWKYVPGESNQLLFVEPLFSSVCNGTSQLDTLSCKQFRKYNNTVQKRSTSAQPPCSKSSERLKFH